MKVLIKSSQIFEEYVDGVEEVHECKLEYLDDGFELDYDDTKVKVEKDILYVDRASMCLKVELDKENASNMQTPYGDIEIKVCGESLKWAKNPFSLNARYRVELGGTLGYMNELQILFVEE